MTENHPQRQVQERLREYISYLKEEKVMAKRCRECGEMKLYLDCMECDDRYCCGDMAKRIKQEEDDDRRKENNARHEAKTADH